ncbi:MAG: hypothetical protein KDK11_05825 [Maritimibacter sp.]|nr:hypothetical protein [Maritimibacter sp.]
MTKRNYDTRTREEILAGARMQSFTGNPGLEHVGLRELRTLDRFLEFASQQGIGTPSVDDFLAFVEAGKSTRPLDDLRTAFDRLLPDGAGVRDTLRDAIRLKRPRSRRCDWRGREQILQEPEMQPYVELQGIEDVALADLRVLSAFLSFASARNVAVPTTEDFLTFVEDVTSSRRLRSLKTALAAILPQHPVHLPLDEAIAEKSPARPSRAGTKPRPTAARRVAKEAFPAEWRTLLENMRFGVMPSLDLRVPAPSVIDSMEDVLREYAAVQIAAGEEIAVTVAGLRRFLDAKTAASATKMNPKYEGEGNRIATRHTAVMRLRQFATILGLDTLVIAAIRNHENELRKEREDEVPLKFGKLDRLPGLSESWDIARGLLDEAGSQRLAQTRTRLTNEAVVVAIWMFLPLRLTDGQLRWRRDIRWDGERYRVDIVTNKATEPLRGRLHPRLMPFIDALILRGVDPAYIDEMRARAVEAELPLFRDVSGRMLAKSYPSSVWRKHFGAGAHIARSRIHTELGALGPEGVEAALALCAQRSPKSHAFYAGQAVRDAQMRDGQDLIGEIIDECLAETGEGDEDFWSDE